MEITRLWPSIPDGNPLMGGSNEWSNPAAAGSEQQAVMLARLEERARCPDQQSVNAAFIDILNPRSGERLLEVGCGSGVICRLTAKQLEPTGKMTGVDISYAFVQAAREMVKDTMLAPLVDYSSGQAGDLPFADQVFDKVFAARLLLHVADPEKVVKEMARVVKHIRKGGGDGLGFRHRGG